jgi:hypothetical protein
VTPRDDDAVMPNDLTPEQLEQLARSVAMSGALTDADKLAVIEVLRAEARRRGAVGER